LAHRARHVAFGLEMKGVPRGERERIARQQLALVKLEKFSASYPHPSPRMSSARASPRARLQSSVLLMDEPLRRSMR